MSASVPRKIRNGCHELCDLGGLRAQPFGVEPARVARGGRVIGDRDRAHAELVRRLRHRRDRVLAIAVGRVAVARGRDVGELDEVRELAGELVVAIAYFGRDHRQLERAVDVGLVGRDQRF